MHSPILQYMTWCVFYIPYHTRLYGRHISRRVNLSVCLELFYVVIIRNLIRSICSIQMLLTRNTPLSGICLSQTIEVGNTQRFVVNSFVVTTESISVD